VVLSLPRFHHGVEKWASYRGHRWGHHSRGQGSLKSEVGRGNSPACVFSLSTGHVLRCNKAQWAKPLALATTGWGSKIPLQKGATQRRTLPRVREVQRRWGNHKRLRSSSLGWNNKNQKAPFTEPSHRSGTTPCGRPKVPRIKLKDHVTSEWLPKVRSDSGSRVFLS
jgi:hypothetical protein